MTLEELEGYFTGIELPEEIELESGVVIEDVPLFLQSHFSYIHNNEGSKSNAVYLLRLHKAIEAIENPVARKAKVTMDTPLVIEIESVKEAVVVPESDNAIDVTVTEEIIVAEITEEQNPSSVEESTEGKI